MKKILMLVLSLALTGGLAQAQKDKDNDKDKDDQKAKTAQAAPEGSAKEEAAEKSTHITSGPTVANLTGTSATLQWTTNKNAANDVHYNCGAGKDKIAYAKGGSTNHSVTLSGLKPGSTCTWKIMTREKEVRQEGQFQTPAK
jgi:hypothetical protein